jgi:hypothetical protein
MTRRVFAMGPWSHRDYRSQQTSRKVSAHFPTPPSSLQTLRKMTAESLQRRRRIRGKMQNFNLKRQHPTKCLGQTQWQLSRCSTDIMDLPTLSYLERGHLSTLFRPVHADGRTPHQTCDRHQQPKMSFNRTTYLMRSKWN